MSEDKVEHVTIPPKRGIKTKDLIKQISGGNIYYREIGLGPLERFVPGNTYYGEMPGREYKDKDIVIFVQKRVRGNPSIAVGLVIAVSAKDPDDFDRQEGSRVGVIILGKDLNGAEDNKPMPPEEGSSIHAGTF